MGGSIRSLQDNDRVTLMDATVAHQIEDVATLSEARDDGFERGRLLDAKHSN